MPEIRPGKTACSVQPFRICGVFTLSGDCRKPCQGLCSPQQLPHHTAAKALPSVFWRNLDPLQGTFPDFPVDFSNSGRRNFPGAAVPDRDPQFRTIDFSRHIIPERVLRYAVCPIAAVDVRRIFRAGCRIPRKTIRKCYRLQILKIMLQAEIGNVTCILQERMLELPVMHNPDPGGHGKALDLPIRDGCSSTGVLQVFLLRHAFRSGQFFRIPPTRLQKRLLLAFAIASTSA